MNRILLAAVNAKFIHSCPAVWSLKLFTEQQAERMGIEIPQIIVREYTINQPQDQIYYDILKERPDVVAFACYLWNIEIISGLVKDLKKVRGDLTILLGGPEVSYGIQGKGIPEALVDGIICGEGERAFAAWTMKKAGHEVPEEWHAVMEEGIIYADPMTDLSELPYLYKDLTPFENRMVYYEASRGCPFRCAYCLSGAGTPGSKENRRVRELPLERVLAELEDLSRRGVRQIKFIDRTFNCDPRRTEAIIRWILDLPEEVPTNFHFEVEAAILADETIELLRTAHAGRIQLEIGIQSTYGPALKACGRNPEVERVFRNIRRLREKGNLNLHVDLIAGLPGETLERFTQSFDEVYALHAHQLQLGFLKLLTGSPMEEIRDRYGYRFSERPPYEILENDVLSPEDLYELKRIEDALEKYGNSQHFERTLSKWEKEERPYGIFRSLAGMLEEKERLFIPVGVFELFELLADFLPAEYRPALLTDYYTYTVSDRIPKALIPIAKTSAYPSAREQRERAEEILRELDRKDPAIRDHRVLVKVLDNELTAIDYSDKDPVTGRFRVMGIFPQ